MKTNFFKLFFLIQFSFLSVGVFAQKELRIMVKPQGSKLWGYCNEKGDMVIEPQFKKAYAFGHNGFALVKINKKALTVIDKEGKVVKELPANYTVQVLKRADQDIIPFHNDDLWGGINIDGNVVVKPKYDFISNFSKDGYASARLNSEFFIVSGSGGESKVNVPDIVAIKRVSEGLAAYKNADGKFGFVNTNGEEAIKPKFVGVGHFKAGLCWVRDENGLIGFIDKKGEYIIPSKYKAVKNFDEVSGMTIVKTDDSEWHYINKKGEKLETKMPIEQVKSFVGGFSPVKVGNVFGFINNKGEWLVQPKYESCGDFKNGYCAVKLNGLWGVIDSNGKEIIPCKFTSMRRAVDIK